MGDKQLTRFEQQQTDVVKMSEWYSKHWEINQTSDISNKDAFNQRQYGRLARFETENTTKWDTYMNNSRIAERLSELSKWYNLVNKYFNRIEIEIKTLRDEKTETEHELDQIFTPLQITTQCLRIRDSRRPTELTSDDADTELKKELNIIETGKEAFIERIQMAYQKISSLENVKQVLDIDLKHKDSALKIDRHNLILNEFSEDIGTKSTALTTPKTAISYEAWLEHCRQIKKLAEEELSDSYNFIEALKMIRERVKNDIKAQKDTTDFALRKRIYQTRKVKSELDWQKLKIQKEMEVLLNEINQLEKAIISKEGFLKCVETRLENRKSRPEYELCIDEVEEGLKEELLHLQETKNNLTCKYNDSKSAFKNLEMVLIRLEKDLDDKGHSLMTDVMCLETRCPLSDNAIEIYKNKTNQNVDLMKMTDKVLLES